MAKQIKTIEKQTKRRLKTSDIIIAILVVVVAVMAYPKVFKSDKFEKIRDADGRISVAVMPFENMSNDTLWDVWQDGIQYELITNLSNSTELAVRQFQTMYDILQSTERANYASITPSVANDISRKLEVNTYIIGNILTAGNKIKVSAQLNDVENGETFKSFQVFGTSEEEMFNLIDTLSNLIRDYLEIRVLEKGFTHEAIIYHSTNSAEAYRHYMKGREAFTINDYASSIESLNKAFEIDSNFVEALMYLSIAYGNLGKYEESMKLLNKALKYRDEVPISLRLFIDWGKAKFDKLPQEEIRYVKQYLEINNQSFSALYMLGVLYSGLELNEKAIEPLERAYELTIRWGGRIAKWQWLYTVLGETYHKFGNHKKEKEVYEHGLSILPDNPFIISRQSICALSQGDSVKADQYIAQFISVSKEHGWSEGKISSRLGNIYSEAEMLDMAEKCYRKAFNFDPQNPDLVDDLAWFLIDNDINVNEGVDLIEKALKLTPDDWNALDTKGWGLYKQGKYEKALKILNDSWNLRPEYNHESYQHIKETQQALANQSQ